MKLQGQQIILRALEPSDIDVLFKWENDTSTWNVSHTTTPYSRFVLEEYIASSHQDIYAAKQLRLIIELLPSQTANQESKRAIGSIDLFDFDPSNLRAGIGILIADKTDRRKGYAKEALQLLVDYCFSTLNLHQLYCNIAIDNQPSISLFQNEGFEVAGTKKEWVREGSIYKDELLLQRINKD